MNLHIMKDKMRMSSVIKIKNYILLIFVLIVVSLLPLPAYADEIYTSDQNRFTPENDYSSFLKNSGVVGKIDGDFSVSPSGQALYDIPLQVPTGSGGMSPKLSITYNSSAGVGLLGKGADLHGLSIIGRAPETKFHDGKPGTVELDCDRFSLDGVRLFNIDDNGSYRHYSCENENYSRITAYGPKTNPDSFVVNTKDGLKYLYKPSNVILKANNSKPSLFWVVTKVSDSVGNYFLVNYKGDAENNEIYPSNIDYTYNESNSTSSYASVCFEYTYSEAPPIYVSSLPVKRQHFLKEIKMQYGKYNVVKYYEFEYDYSPFRLKSIIEKAQDKETKLNATIFCWSDIDNNDAVQNDKITGEENDKITQSRFSIGDFNGDGKDDILITPREKKEDGGNAKWELRLSNGSKFVFENSGYFLWNGEIQDVFTGDYNGDGYCDFVVKTHFGSYYVLDLYLSKKKQGSFTFEIYNPTIFQSIDDYSVQTVDFNCDGISDLFVWQPESNKNKFFYSQIENGIITPLKYQKYRYDIVEKWDRVEFFDYNGDGITDILNLNDEGSEIIVSNGDGTLSNKKINSYLCKKDHFVFGDFNGDGKTDILQYDKEPYLTESIYKDGSFNAGNWHISLSHGTGQYAVHQKYDQWNFPVFRSKGSDPNTFRQLFVADINGDGLDDVIAVKLKADDNSGDNYWAYINYGTYFYPTELKGFEAKAVDKWNYFFGDFNGDGKKDIVCNSNRKEKGDEDLTNYRLFLMHEKSTKLVTKITDGMGNDINIKYKNMSDADVYERGEAKSALISSFSSSIPLVYEVDVPNGVEDGRNVTQYSYYNALKHYDGRGFLGFETFETNDLSTNTRTIQTCEIELTKIILSPSSSQTYINDVLVSESSTTNKIFQNSTSSHVFSYLPVKTESTTYEYNSGEVVSHSVNTMDYDKYGNVTKTVSKTGDLKTTTTNTYTTNTSKWYLGRLTKAVVKKEYNGLSETRTSAFEYDSSSGLLSAEIVEPSNKEFGSRKEYKRDVYGNIVESTIKPLNTNEKPRTTKTNYAYSGRFVSSVTDNLGFTETNSRIDPGLGIVFETKDANGLITNYGHDRFGNVTHIRTGSSTEYISSEYTVTGWSSAWGSGRMEDAPSNSVYFSYSEVKGEPKVWVFFDRLGREVRRVTENFDAKKKIYVDKVYNSKGQLVKSSEPYLKGTASPNIFWSTVEYDDCGRVIKQTAPDGSVTTIKYDGLVTTTTDPLGHKSSKEVNMQGLLVRSTDANGNSIYYTYDAGGRTIEIEGPNKQVLMEYDILGSRTYLYDSDCGETYSKYNVYGELVETSDDNNDVKYEYDGGGRMIKEIRPDVTITNVYDTIKKGLLTSTTSSNGIKKSYNYDNFCRVTSMTQSDSKSKKTYQINYTYNGNNQLDKIVYPNSALTIQNKYSKNGTLLSVEDVTSGKVYWKLNSENARGDIESESYGNGLTSTIKYDAKNGRIAQMTTQNGNNTLLNWSYKYSSNGCLTERKNIVKNLTETFTYDNLDRLLSSSINGTVRQKMTYDASGNILSKTGVGTYVYQKGTNILKEVETSNNLKEWDEIEYTSYNKINKIVSGNNTLELVYGPTKQRVAGYLCEGSTKTSRFYFDSYYEEIEKGNEITGKCYIYASGKCIAVVENKKVGSKNNISVFYVHHDQLGSVQAYSDESAQLALELSYDAWGRRRDPNTWQYLSKFSDGGKYLDRGFGGHEHIDLFDMVNMDGRMYDPILGRFLSPDPFVQAPDYTQSLNRYVYCLNNPLSLIDPSGYSWLSDNWKMLFSSTVAIGVSVLTGGTGAALGTAIIAGALGGAAGALTYALLNGANFGQIAKSTIQGAAIGGLSGFFNFASGEGELLERLFKHTLSGAWLEGIQGGNMVHGAVSGLLYGANDYFIGGSSLHSSLKIAESIALGGTVSELGGGKFANGAVSSAFSMLFNGLMHQGKEKSASQQIIDVADDVEAGCVGVMAIMIADDVTGFGVGDDIVLPIPAGIAITCETVKAAIKSYKAVSDKIADVSAKVSRIKDPKRVWVTYTLTSPDGKVYVGRSSGYGDPVSIVMKRFANHHMKKYGFGNPQLDKYATGYAGHMAIRGREQQMMDYFGGVGSPRVGNRIRGVSKWNPAGRPFHNASSALWGEVHEYTGF